MVFLPEQGCWAKLRYLPDSTLGIGTVPALGPIAGSLRLQFFGGIDTVAVGIEALHCHG
jgi:hypothetical protein